MAKKRTKTTTTSTANYSFVKVCAFWSLILAGVAELISFILQLCHILFSDKVNSTLTWLSSVSGICSIVAKVALFATVWLAAWDFVKGKGKNWRIVYWVFFALSLLAFVGFSITSFFVG